MFPTNQAICVREMSYSVIIPTYLGFCNPHHVWWLMVGFQQPKFTTAFLSPIVALLVNAHIIMSKVFLSSSQSQLWNWLQNDMFVNTKDMLQIWDSASWGENLLKGTRTRKRISLSSSANRQLPTFRTHVLDVLPLTVSCKPFLTHNHIL